MNIWYSIINLSKFEDFTVAKIQVEVLWIVTLCSVCICFIGPCYFHLQGEGEGSKVI